MTLMATPEDSEPETIKPIAITYRSNSARIRLLCLCLAGNTKLKFDLDIMNLKHFLRLTDVVPPLVQ